MKSLYNLLNDIHQRPGVYLGSPSVSYLHMFLCGYGFSRQEQGLEITAEEREFERFQAWVQKRFNVSASMSWARIILLHSVDERAGFELFFELLDAFVSEQHPKQEIKAQLAKVGFDLEEVL